MRRAFSLIELLTVIAIMAILAAILMPVFVQVKNLAYQHMAGQSIQKLHMVTSLYMADHDDTYPIAYYPNGDGPRQNWFGVVDQKGHVNSNTSLYAPYIRGRIQPDKALNAKPWMGDETGFGYNWGYLGSDFYTANPESNFEYCFNPATGSSLSSASDTIMYATSVYFFAEWLQDGDNIAYRYGFVDPPKTWFGNPTVDFRHMGLRTVDVRRHEVTSTGVAMVVFADGHLKSLTQKQVKNKNFVRDPQLLDEPEER